MGWYPMQLMNMLEWLDWLMVISGCDWEFNFKCLNKQFRELGSWGFAALKCSKLEQNNKPPDLLGY